jgi:hypothetical protein
MRETADPSHIGAWVRRGTTEDGRDPRRAVAGEAGDAVDTRRLNGLDEGHRRPEGGEPPGQHGLARPGRADEEDVVGRTPASRLASLSL